jgi:hypothetical protein
VPYLRDHIHTYGTPRPGLGVLLPTVPHASPTQTAGKTNLMNDIGHRFAGLVRAVIDDAQSVDHDDLLLAANAYLAATPPSTVPSKKLSGQMAHAAMELAVHMTPAHFAKLRQLTLAFTNSV